MAVYLYEKGADPQVPDAFPELSGRAHQVLGDYFLSRDDYEKARAAFQEARNNYQATLVTLQKQVSHLEFKEIMVSLATAFASQAVAGSYQAAGTSRQLAQVRGLNYATRTGTGTQGYMTYMNRYNRAYVPTYSAIYMPLVGPPPVNAPLDQQKAYAQERVKHLEQLSSLMDKVLGCFSRNLSGSELHLCMDDAIQAAANTTPSKQ